MPSTKTNPLTVPVQYTTKALKPGWVILVLGGSAYVLSETRFIGATLSIVLMAATIFQINQYIQTRKSGGV